MSLRPGGELAAGLDAMAAEGTSVSQMVRVLLNQAVVRRPAVASRDAQVLSHRLAADVAEVRRRLAG